MFSSVESFSPPDVANVLPTATFFTGRGVKQEHITTEAAWYGRDETVTSLTVGHGKIPDRFYHHKP